MTPQDLVRITGQHLLFLGIPTYSWSLIQFQQAAQFARSHGVDSLLIKVADGGNIWYGGMPGWHSIRNTILAQGVGAIPYIYSYGNKFGALDTEIDIMIAHLQDSGIVCMNAEVEWNGQTSWAQHLCSRIQPVSGTFLVSTWADPSLQNWPGVIRTLAPCTTVFMPQQYNNYLATFWQEFGNNGAIWLQPTVNLTQDFGANDPVTIAKNAYNQGHTAISVWHYDTAVGNPNLLDAVYAAFPKGGNMNTYGPGKGDFDQYFTVNSDGNWTCKRFNTVLIGGNKGLYSQISMDGNTLPIIGLPRTNELYQHDTDSYSWSVQFFERGVIVYDPSHRRDSQPGLGASYFGKYSQFMQFDPDYQPVVVDKIPDAVVADIKAVKAASDKLTTDANLP
jgi:hypothetical protein